MSSLPLKLEAMEVFFCGNASDEDVLGGNMFAAIADE
jgi:hypothetical protein